MTPKEKAEYLIDSFVRDGYDLVMSDRMAKWCALFAVDEIIEVLVDLSNGEFTYIHNVEYWEQVKQEIKQS
jgi:hypothetical protein